MESIVERVLIFIVGAIFVIGGVRFIFVSMDAQRAGLAAIGYGILAFVGGLSLCLWAFVGPPG